MHTAACAAFGYFVGTINPAFLISKLKGFDIRHRGSGNAGATNALLTMGNMVGVLCAVLDILKAFLAYKTAKALFPMLQFAGILAAAACVIGHIFPVWMGFQGGKGLACLGGMILAHSWKLLLCLLALEVGLILVVDYICVVPMSGSLLFLIIYALSTGDAVGTIALLAVTVVIQYKHLENLKRIKEGSEFHFSFLWNREKEIERVMQVVGEERLDELV